MKKYLFIVLLLSCFYIHAFGQNYTVVAGTTGGDAGSVGGVVIADILRSDQDDSTTFNLQMGRCDIDSALDFLDTGDDTLGFGLGPDILISGDDGAGGTAYFGYFNKGVFTVGGTLDWDGAGGDYDARAHILVDGIGALNKNIRLYSYGNDGANGSMFQIREHFGVPWLLDDVIIDVYNVTSGTSVFTVDKEGDVESLGNLEVQSLVNFNASFNDAIIDKDISTPPGFPVHLGGYIVGSSPTGDWAGHENDLAIYHGVGAGLEWLFITASLGHTVYVLDETLQYTFNGTTWVESIKYLTTPLTYTKEIQLVFDGKGIASESTTTITVNTNRAESFGVGDSGYYTFAIPSIYHSGDVTLNVHSYQTAVESTKEFQWQVEYRATTDGDLISGVTATITSGDIIQSGTQYEDEHATLIITEANISGKDHVTIKLSRIAIAAGVEASKQAVWQVTASFLAKQDNSI